jgi:hypothetical protein
MRQVVDELHCSGFILPSNLDAQAISALPVDKVEQLLPLSRRVGTIEKEFKDPDGTLAKLEGRIKSLEDQRADEAIERGGMTFRDVVAVSGWVQTFKDKDLYWYCVDMVTHLMLCGKRMIP